MSDSFPAPGDPGETAPTHAPAAGGVIAATPAQGQLLDAHQRQLRTLGGQLRQAREARGLSLEGLAERLRLGREQLRALEEADTRHLPELVFVIAQLRRVAGALQLDLGDQLAQLRAGLPTEISLLARPSILQPLGASDSPVATPAPRSGSGLGSAWSRGWPLWPVAVLLAISALGLALTLGLQRRGGAPSPLTSPSQDRAPATTPGSGQAAATPSLGQGESAANSLTLQASETSWLEVRSGRGEVLFRGSFQGSRSFPLESGLRLLAGRPDLIAVSRAGQPARKLGPISAVVWTDFPATAQEQATRTSGALSPAPADGR